jgi:TolB protein
VLFIKKLGVPIIIFSAFFSYALFAFLLTSRPKASTSAPLPVINSEENVTKTHLVSTPGQSRFSTSTLNSSVEDGLRDQGTIFLSMRDGPNFHIFTYNPFYLPLTRITASNWDDISPSLSPDGTFLAYSSRQNGYWDIYILNLHNNLLERLTDTPAYDAFPSWSPDSESIAYESYIDENMEILIRSTVDLSQPAVRLTNNNVLDCFPVWSPIGKRIAFVSTRSGEEEIWLANLDETENRFSNISLDASSLDIHPAWSPDGRYLAWASLKSGDASIKVWDSKSPQTPPRIVGAGDWPIWNPAGDIILSRLVSPNMTFLAGYNVNNGIIYLPPIQLSGSVAGIDWKAGRGSQLLENFLFPIDSESSPKLLWQSKITTNLLPPGGRYGVSKLDGIIAPYPYLHDSVDESFMALRDAANHAVGWNLLDTLANAYLPITEPPPPNMQQNWLFTGRSFEINPVPVYAGWITIAREDFSGQTYWRVFVKSRYQDGSQGMPFHQQLWDINARFSGNPKSYEEGGQPVNAPSGYWIDFTELASAYGWERISALPEWRSYYEGSRFGQFVLSDGLNWDQAMLQLYPPEVMATQTYISTSTRTPSGTPQANILLPPSAPLIISKTQVP